MAAMANIIAIGKWRVAWSVVGVMDTVELSVFGCVVGRSGKLTVWLLHLSPLQHTMLHSIKLHLACASNQSLKCLQPSVTSVVEKKQQGMIVLKA